MFRRLFARRRRNESIAYSLYGAIVAQARQPAFYLDFEVPDTLDGRFDMIVLHAFLLLNRIRGESEADRAIGQQVFDAFVADMDRSLREIGVGDMGVPKRVKRMAEAFYGRVGAYGTAINAPEPSALDDAIGRNIFPDSPDRAAAGRLAAYVRAAAASLAAQPTAAILAGTIEFPAPEASDSQEAA